MTLCFICPPYSIPYFLLASYSEFDPLILGPLTLVYLYLAIQVPLPKEIILSALDPHSIPSHYGYTDCSLFIDSLTANIHILMNIYRTCLFVSGLSHLG